MTLAFNTIGWEAQNLLFNTLDALLASPEISDAFDNEQPAEVQATIQDSTVTAGANLSLSAISEAQINSTISNQATSAAVALYGASATSASAVLSSNMVSSVTRATIDHSGAAGIVNATEGITVNAEDNAGISANTDIVALASRTNDLGAGILNRLADHLLRNYQFKLAFGYPANQVARWFGWGMIMTTAWGRRGRSISIWARRRPGFGNQDYTDFALWKELDEVTVIPSGLTSAAMKALEIASGTSQSYYGVVVRNDVRGEVESVVNNTTLTGGSIAVQAVENAQLNAMENSAVTAQSSERGGVIATNLVQSSSHATITNSDVTSTSADILVDAKNTSIINASTTSAARASDAIGVVVAFNTIGWEAQNLLFNAIDALIGSPEVADAFGAENPAEVLAYIQDSTVNAAGDVIVHAENLAQLNAALANENVSSVANTLVLAASYGFNDVRNRNAGQQQGEQPDPAYIDFTGSQERLRRAALWK